jgi:hypothetical protein
MAKPKAKPARRASKPARTFDAIPDTLDFRDRMFQPTLIEVPPRIDLDLYRKWRVPILDQGIEGACTGFGLATIANYLLLRRTVDPDPVQVSPRMFYEMAKRYDEWPGEDYSGSSARGAMKGWHKHGVCTEDLWKYNSSRPDRNLSDTRVRDAAHRPLGAYYRVNHKDLISMHTALAEVGILYATATVHEGWQNVGSDGIIEYTEDQAILGGHAFAIVGYDRNGLWVQNSWGPDWGMEGFAQISYDDWLRNGTDVWVARLGAPVVLHNAESTATSISAAAGKSDAYAFCTLRSHIISFGNDGRLRTGGAFGTSESDVAEIFREIIPTALAKWKEEGKKKRLLFFAHGGLVSEESAVQRVADYRTTLLESGVYILSFVWKTDYWTTLGNMIQDALRRRRPEGFLDAAKDFMLDRLDDALEPVARAFTGKSQWDEMKENALMATTTADGGVRVVLKYLAELLRNDPEVEVHVVGHSAGSIFHAPFVQMLTTEGKIDVGPLKGKNGYGLKVSTCTLWAPAITIDLFKQTYLQPIRDGGIRNFALFNMTDRAEQDDDCANIYHKSLLYLVSNAFESRPRIPLVRDGEPILGMEKFVRKDPDLVKLFQTKKADLILSPNNATEVQDHSTCHSHGSFDDDRATLQATFARILNSTATQEAVVLHRTAAGLRDKRQMLA